MNLLRTLALSLLAGVVGLTTVLGLATPATAHAGLVGSDPGEGSTLAQAPTEVTLSFSEEVRLPAYVFVTGPDKQTHEIGDPEITGAVVTQRVELPEQTAGSWTIAYRVVSADGHPISGQVPFTVEGDVDGTDEPTASATPSESASDTPAPSPSATPETGDESSTEDDEDGNDDNGGAPLLIAAVLALLLVTVAAFVARRSRGQK